MNTILLYKAVDIIAAIYMRVRSTDPSGPVASPINRVKVAKLRSPKNKALVGDLKGRHPPISRRASDSGKPVS